MSTLIAVITWAFFGLLIGAVARLLVPGRQTMGLFATMFLGICGSLVGGFIAWVFAGGEPLQASGAIMSVLGAIVFLVIAARATEQRRMR